MARVPMQNVRVLSLREIAEMWSPEAQIPFETMLRELRIAVINIPRLREGQELLELDDIPPDDELHDPDERVDRQWLMEFCDKQEGWRMPEFWRDRAELVARRQGRPSLRDRVIAHFDELAGRGDLADTISEQARVIHEWLVANVQGERIPEPKTIQAHIRERWHEVRGERG